MWRALVPARSDESADLNKPVTDADIADGRDSVLDQFLGEESKFVRRTGRESFQMDETEDMSGQELKHKVQQLLFEKGDIDTAELDKRLVRLREETRIAQASEIAGHGTARIDPESLGFARWQVAMVLLAAASACSLCYQIAFPAEFSGGTPHPILIFEYLADGLFALNVLLHFNVGFTREGKKVMELHAVRKRYALSPAFAFDLLGCLPTDLFQLASGTWHPAWRLNRFARLWSLRGHLRRLQDDSDNPTFINYIVISRLILIWLLLPNLFTVIRITLLRVGDDDAWKRRSRNLDPTQTDIALYLRSLHWSMGVLSGYGDGTIPETGLQYLFTLAVLNIGLFTFAYTVGVLSAIGDSNRLRSRNFQVAVSAMQHFATRYELPASFQRRITDYFGHRWESLRSNEKELLTAAELLEELPPCVRYDAVECMTADALNKVPLFARVEEGFIHALTQKMEAVSTSIGEELVRQGEVCDGLYIVLKGTLAIVINGRAVNEVGKGSTIGEQSMLTGNPAGATVTSLSFCELYRLRREPFEELSHKFVETFEGFKQAAKLEAKNAKKQAKVGKKGAGASGWNVARQKTVGTKAMGGLLGGLLGGAPSGAATAEDGGGSGSGVAGRLAASLRRILPTIPILPHSRTRAVWAGVLLVALTYEALALPFKLVFVQDVIVPGLTALDVLADLVMAIDVALRRYLAYTEDGRLILDLGKIRKRLMRKHTLVPLLCSAFPCSVLLPLWPLVDARLLQALRAVRVIRLAPYLLYPDPVQKQQPSNLEELLRTVRSSAFDLQFSLTKLAPLLGFYLGCVHYVACAYWAVVHVVVPTDEAVAYAAAAAAAASASGNGSAPSLVMLGGDAASTSPVWTNQSLVALKARIGISKWLPDAAYLKYGQMASYYLRAFYFATCNLTGLGAAVVPYAVPSVLFTLGCFVIGVMVFAYLTSAIVTLVMQADAAAVSYKQGYRQLLGFMQDAGIEHSIMHRASKWLSQWWQAHGGVNLDSIIRELPPSLALEIKTFVFERSAKGGSFFAPKGDGTPCLSAKELVRVAHDLRFEVYNHGEWVLRKGMLNDKFFLVAYGELQVLLDDGTEIIAGRRRMSTQTTNLRNAVVAELGKGECVGEHSAILKGKCEASVRARGSVELLVLQRDAIQRLVRRNPLIKHRIHLLMSTRFAENLYLTTGKVTMAGTATAMRCMLKFIAHWRRRKAERQQQAAAEGAHAAGSPAPAPTPAAAPRQPTPPMRQLSA